MSTANSFVRLRSVIIIGLVLTLGLVIVPPSGGTATTLLVGNGTPTTSAAHPFTGDPAWIAYYGARGEGIGLIHPDGTGDHRIAGDVREDQLLADWSPDGKTLVFTTRGGGETEPLFVYDLATDSSHQLFDCDDPCIGDDEPAYSPDGTRVAFIRALAPFVDDAAHQGGEVPSDCGVWIGDVASGAVSQVTSNTDPPCDREYNPRWSPDGTRFAYWRDPYQDGQPTGTAVYVINADGTDERRLTDPAMFAGEPDWSPDGEWIVFDTFPLNEFGCCPVSNLYRMHADGSGVEQLTHFASGEPRATQPRYSPDGRWIIFTAATPDSRSLWAIPAGGGEPIVLAPGGVYTHGAWQPATAGT